MSLSPVNSRARWLGATAIALILSVTAPSTASAQLFFDWGGSSEKKVNDTGRMSVRINAPEHKAGDIIVSFSDRKLFMMVGPNQAVSFPVAIPREQDRWEGKTSVTQKRENPSWTPTPTMIKENPRLPRWVPGGHPMNPLGNRALYLGSSLYRIHGTDAPWTIGTAVSKGCIRLYNKDALEVYERTKVGAKVLVTWKSYQFQPDGSSEGQQQAAQQGSPHPEQAAPAQSRGSRDLARAFDPNATEPLPRRRRPAAETAEGTIATPQPPAAGSDASARPVRASHTRVDQQTRPRSATQGSSAQGNAAQGNAGQTQPTSAQQNQQPRRTRERTAASAPASAAPIAAAAAAAASGPSAAFEDGAPSLVSPIETSAVSTSRSPASVEAEPAEAPRSAPRPAPAAAAPRPQPAAAPASEDLAARALLAAERAAAAAERAAAAAERAERAAKAPPAATAAAPAASAEPTSAQSSD